MSNILEVLSQNIIIDKDKCVFCGKCADVCILDNIRLKLAPCSKACPLDLNCQGYMQLVARGEEKRALEIIYEKLPFPGILGRVCHHPCEAECTRNDLGEQAVALKSIKRYLADTQTDVVAETEVAEEKSERVAIIGGGPAGMMAAYELRKKGYQVDLYEAEKCLGGMLASSIPEFKLPMLVLQKEARILAEMGVNVLYNTAIGKNVPLAKVLEDYNAVIIAIGMQQDKALGLDGEKAQNVYGALDFLKQAKASAQNLAVGKRVLVIGGGNTAINAAQTAYRLGADDVRMVCLEKRHEMPAYKWEVADVLEEGCAIENGWGPKAFSVEGDKVTAVEFKRCIEVFDQQGKFAPQYCEGEVQSFAADTVIIAVGMKTDLGLVSGSEIVADCSFINVDPVTKQTNIKKVFAAGDIAPGLKTVADAMAQGREAAESVYRFLEELPLSYDRDRFSRCVLDFDIDTSKAEAIPPVQVKKLVGSARRTFDETEACMSKDQALMEAKRCISCGESYGKFHTCWSCLPCEVECPEEALYVRIPYLMR